MGALSTAARRPGLAPTLGSLGRQDAPQRRAGPALDAPCRGVRVVRGENLGVSGAAGTRIDRQGIAAGGRGSDYALASRRATARFMTSRPSRVTVEPPPLTVPRLSHAPVHARPAFKAIASPISGIEPNGTPHALAAASKTSEGRLLPTPTCTAGMPSWRQSRFNWSCLLSPPCSPVPPGREVDPSSSPRHAAHQSGFMPCRHSSLTFRNLSEPGHMDTDYPTCA